VLGVAHTISCVAKICPDAPARAGITVGVGVYVMSEAALMKYPTGSMLILSLGITFVYILLMMSAICVSLSNASMAYKSAIIPLK